MGDRCWANITIKECPKPLRVAANAILERWEFHDQTTSDPNWRLKALDEHPRGIQFICDDLRVGEMPTVASDLVDLGAIMFLGWQDPYGEWLGDMVLHVPGQPLFHGECDSQGEVFVRHSTIVKHAKAHRLTFEQAARDLFAVDLQAAYDHVEPPPPPVTVAQATADLPRIAKELNAFPETI